MIGDTRQDCYLFLSARYGLVLPAGGDALRSGYAVES